MKPAIRFTAMSTDLVTALQSGAPDANGQQPEAAISEGGNGVPCRHCLQHVGDGESYLILAHRPFQTVQPYAECGPLFLHAHHCERYPEDAELPPMFSASQYILRGYSADERILYGTGQIVPTDEIPARAAELFNRSDVAFIHVRSATNNCYQCRIDRVSLTKER